MYVCALSVIHSFGMKRERRKMKVASWRIMLDKLILHCNIYAFPWLWLMHEKFFDEISDGWRHMHPELVGRGASPRTEVD